MITYLAEPIDFASGMDREKPNQMANQLAASGHSVFRPSMAWLGTTGRADHVSQDVMRLNREVLDRSGLVVAYLPSNVRTLGVPMEIAWATERGIAAVVLTDPGPPSATLSGNPLVVTIDRVDMLQWAIRQARQRADLLADRIRSPLPEPRRRALHFRQTEHGGGLAKAHADDAGFDLFTVEDATIAPGGFTFIRCGVEVALPEDTFGWVVARSSAMTTWGLVVTPGIIDPGFRGELGVPAYRTPGTSPWPSGEADDIIPRGTRLAQLVVLPNVTRTVLATPRRGALPEPTDARGTNGFGSTGTAAMNGDAPALSAD